MMALRDRVIRLERLPARLLQSHDGNWRTHPQMQQDALSGVLREVGIAGALLVYRNDAGEYVTIDGHLRKSLDPEQLWPCLVLDVDDAEAELLLATHDHLAAMAEANTEALARLLQDVQSGEAAVQEMLSALAETEGLFGEIGDDVTEGDSQALLKQTQPVKVAIAVADVAVVERALRATGVDNRGQALLILCHAFLEHDSYAR